VSVSDPGVSALTPVSRMDRQSAYRGQMSAPSLIGALIEEGIRSPLLIGSGMLQATLRPVRTSAGRPAMQAASPVIDEDHGVKWTARNIGAGDRADAWDVEGGGATVEVRVPPGPHLLHRLEHAVSDALGVPARPAAEPPRWRIEESAYSHGDIFELEQDTIWTVVDAVGGTPLWEFRGGTSHVLEGGQWSAATGAHGVDEVILGADGLHVLVRDSREVTCHPLPDS